jgi:anaerobic carbon-monoxide dehydrogenase catalytic subunit
MTKPGQTTAAKDRVSCEMSRGLIDWACEHKVETVWDRFEAAQPQCGFGQLGLCCTTCNLGPCRIDPFGAEDQAGVCGATADTITARNLARKSCAGSACHSDHGRHMAHAMLLMAQGEAPSYTVRDPAKLRIVAAEYDVKTEGRDDRQIARDLAEAMLADFGRQDGQARFVARAPAKQQEIWKKLQVTPSGIDRAIVETLARTNMGVETNPEQMLMAALKASLVDGWGGSMIGTEVSDILFGSPHPIRARANLGVLQAKDVNIVLHGHVPILSEVIVDAAQSPDMLALAREVGAEGITIAGICCTANEILMRRGIPVAGSFLQQELAIATGAVELMVVDLQCIMPSLPRVASCFHTKIVSTDPRAQFPGAVHVELDERHALQIAKRIVKMGIDNFPNRNGHETRIPDVATDVIAGFTAENVFHFLGGKFRSTYRPLNDAIMSGRLRGVAGVVGCDNPKNSSGGSHLAMVKELIKHDVLVVQTGCSALACAKAGLLVPEAAFQFAGKGLQEICEAVGIPPVLHVGSCVDNTRILIACCNMVKEGGIGNDISELPVAGAAPEWMSEKAIAIGWYVVGSGIFTVFGSPLNVMGSPRVAKYLTEDLEGIVGGKWAFESDPVKAAHLMIEHIDKKREALHLKPMMYE